METTIHDNPVSSHVISQPALQTSVLDDPFDGYFKNAGVWVPRDALLNIPQAKRWFKVVEWGSRADLYTFQQALESKSGPRVQINGRHYWMMSSYDYLGLIGHPAIKAATTEAIEIYGTGTGGARMLTGTTALHRHFEKELAAFKGTEAALTFSSGYTANVGVIPALFDRRDRVIIDALAHRSIMDGCKLAGVPVQSFTHNDPSSLRQELETPPFGRRTLIVVEGVYSMDGDICPLPEIVSLKNRYGAHLMIDDAHSFCAISETGRGVDEYFGLSANDVDIWMGTLSKAIPSNGGFIAGRQDLIIYLQHGASPFFFSGALNPVSTAAARESLRVCAHEPQRLKTLQTNADYLRTKLNELGYDTGASVCHIIPVIVGKNETAYQLSRALFDMGILALPVVFPAVPRGKARLRLCATAAQSKEMLQEVIDAFSKVRQNGYVPVP